jgi:hypothetical protein
MLMGERTYNIQGISFRYRITNTVTLLSVSLILFCYHFRLDTVDIVVSIIVTTIAFIAIWFIYKKTIPSETIVLNSKGFSYSKKKIFPIKKEESYFFEWKEIIGYETFEFRWTQEFQLNFKDLTCFKFNRYDIWNNDDFDEMYYDLQKYSHLFNLFDTSTNEAREIIVSKKFKITELPVLLWLFTFLILFLIFLQLHFKLEFGNNVLDNVLFGIMPFVIATLTYHLLKRKLEIEITNKGINLNYLKRSIYFKSKIQSFDWSSIYSITHTNSWRGPQGISSDLNINFKNNLQLTLTRIDLLNKDDFNKCYQELQSHSERFVKLNKSQIPKPITIYETRGIQFAMILITLFTIFISYHSISQPSEGGMIVIAIFGFASLYYWYRVLDNWSKKSKEY